MEDNNAYKCNVCAENFILIGNSELLGNHNYCYPIDSSLNCATASISSITKGGKYVCNTCLGYGYLASISAD